MTNYEKFKQTFPNIPEYSGFDLWGDFWEAEYQEPNKDQFETRWTDVCVDVANRLEEQDKIIKAMRNDLESIRSCKVCKNYNECTPDAGPESEEFKMWRDCGGSCKLNWKWRGI